MTVALIVVAFVAVAALGAVCYAGHDVAKRLSAAAADSELSARQERAAERDHLYQMLRLVKVQHPRELDAAVDSLFPAPQAGAVGVMPEDRYDADLDGGNNVPA